MQSIRNWNGYPVSCFRISWRRIRKVNVQWDFILIANDVLRFALRRTSLPRRCAHFFVTTAMNSSDHSLRINLSQFIVYFCIPDHSMVANIYLFPLPHVTGRAIISASSFHLSDSVLYSRSNFPGHRSLTRVENRQNHCATNSWEFANQKRET